MGGTHYKVGAFVVVDSSLLPEFACIVDIVVTEGFDCVFVCEKYVLMHTFIPMKSLNALQA